MLEKLLSTNLHDMLILIMPFTSFCALTALGVWLLGLRNRRLALRLGITAVLVVLAGLSYWLR